MDKTKELDPGASDQQNVEIQATEKQKGSATTHTAGLSCFIPNISVFQLLKKMIAELPSSPKGCRARLP